MKALKIGKLEISNSYRPIIIAEMSGNHNQSIENALKIVDEAAKCGADMIKLQTYTPDTMTLNLDVKNFRIDDNNSLWKGQSLYELYKKAHTPWEWHREIFNHAKKRNLICFSSPFDESAVDFLETLNVPVYKIASFENTDLPLIKKVISTKKPVIISTGLSTISELSETVEFIRDNGCQKFILLKCTSTYPAKAENSNLLTIPHMREMFNCHVGLSDHTKGIGTAVASVSLGARVIEKHFTLSRKDGGVDSAFSIEPTELKSLVNETKRAWQSLGVIKYGPTDAEMPSLKYRRSIYISKDLSKGTKLTKSNTKVIRPGYGLEPKHYENILGMKLKKNVKKGTALSWNLI